MSGLPRIRRLFLAPKSMSTKLTKRSVIDIRPIMDYLPHGSPRAMFWIIVISSLLDMMYLSSVSGNKKSIKVQL